MIFRALKNTGCRITAFDIEPEHYINIAKNCGVDVVKCDIERNELGVADADCAVFTEVLEHLHYHYAPVALARISRALRAGGYLILTTPNIASLFRRLRLLLGKQPIYKYHVREYTMDEVLEMVREASFDVVKAYYSIVNDLTYTDAEPNDYLKISGYRDLIKVAVKRPTKLNTLRALAYPIVKLIPSLRQLIVIIGVKVREPSVKLFERW
uniref:Methyltransferase domain-containing protein n=1 Tax=Ignisphaera aggregans TaxID=334771 RepID=A0A7J3Z7I7_9CREN